MAKYYKDYEKRYIGDSDIAALVMVGIKKDVGLSAEILNFEEDADYRAYVVDWDTEIPDHYHLVAEWTHWLKIYDDDQLTFSTYCKNARVWRAGMRGVIIQIEKRDE